MTRALFLGLLAIAQLGCGASIRRFPLAEPMWDDDDRRAFGPPPPEWYSPYLWDGLDNSSFRPLSDTLGAEPDREAVDVNALDEVPSSSWYENRLSRHEMTPPELAAGACDAADLEGLYPPFRITRGKPDGASPGFFVEDARGRRYLLKPDGEAQPERASAADAIGAAIFHAAGYFVPCNRVAYVRRDELVLAEGAIRRSTAGDESPLTEADVDSMLENADVDDEGRIRVGLSEFIDAEPISPWRYEGTWEDDPNDVVPHEHRREVRAMFVLSAWLAHIDARQENTMAAFVEGEDGTGWIRHYMIDFGDCLGIRVADEALSRRFGHAGYVDFQAMAEDFLTLGLLDRPWMHASYGPAGATFAYFDVERFDPEAFRPGYPNPAYDRMTERDAAWMARIVARIRPEHVSALVERGRFSRSILSDELERILLGRRERILERWLTRLSPLTDPTIGHGGRGVCVEDRAVTSGLRSAAGRRYEALAWSFDPFERRELTLVPEPGRICAVLPPSAGPTRRYAVVDLVASSIGGERTRPLRVHLYDLGSSLRVVGLERLDGEGAPSP